MIDILISIGLFSFAIFSMVLLVCFANKGTTNSEKNQSQKQETTGIYMHKIINGSKITIGKSTRCLTIVNVDQHFNKFQKKMWKFLLGISVEDYSEE